MRGFIRGLAFAAASIGLLGSGPCGGQDIPQSLDLLVQGDPSVECIRWQDTIADIYMRKMGCSGDYMELSPKEVKFRGVSYHPVLVEWQAGIASRYVASLEQRLAPIVHAENQFRDAETGEPADLFDQGFVERHLFGKQYTIQGDPPLSLMAADFRMADAVRIYEQMKQDLQKAPDSPDRQKQLDAIAHNGPIQEALVPLGRALAEKCQSRLYSAQTLAEFAAQPSCAGYLHTDSFLKALFGEQRVGQAETIAREALSHAPRWYDPLLHRQPTAAPGGESPSSGSAH